MSEIRVDSITDEVGTGAPEITDHYKKSNILGTVSESGGVPTGAIIERGSNANGEYVKYADGTIICTLVRSFSVGIWSSGTQRGTGAWTYPASFVGAIPSVNVVAGFGSNNRGGGVEKSSIVYTSAGNAAAGFGSITELHADALRVQAFANADGNGNLFFEQFYAIGRWY